MQWLRLRPPAPPSARPARPQRQTDGSVGQVSAKRLMRIKLVGAEDGKRGPGLALVLGARQHTHPDGTTGAGEGTHTVRGQHGSVRAFGHAVEGVHPWEVADPADFPPGAAVVIAAENDVGRRKPTGSHLAESHGRGGPSVPPPPPP